MRRSGRLSGMIKPLDSTSTHALQIDCSACRSRSCRTSHGSCRSAGQRTFSLILHVTQRDAGDRAPTFWAAASSCAPPARRPQQPAPPRRSRARPPDGSGPPGDPGLMSAPARDHLGSAACGRRPATREPGRNAGQGHRRHPDRPDRIPAARTLHRDRDQLHRQE